MSGTVRLRLFAVLALALLACSDSEGLCPDGYVSVAGHCQPTSDGGLPPNLGDGGPGECVPAEETCNGIDDDCDESVDESLSRACGSTEGSCTMGEELCAMGSWSECDGVAPASEETCDGLDDDCDGAVDESCPCSPGETQACGTDVGECSQGAQTCGDDGAWGECTGAALPDAELCDGLDNDCDGRVDNGNPEGGAACGSEVGACMPGTMTCTGGMLGCAGAFGPTDEVCDEVDNDCDGSTDEGAQERFFRDMDGDGDGVLEDEVRACTAPPGYVDSGDDCDDTNPAIFDGNPEVCDGLDNNCSNVADSTFACALGSTVECTTSCGSTGSGTCTGSCALPTDSACAPPAESCNHADDDCDGFVDDGVSSLGVLRTPGISDVDEVRIVPRSAGFLLYMLSGSTLRAQMLDAGGAPVGAATTIDTQVNAFDADQISGAQSVLFYRYLNRAYARRITAGTSIGVGAEIQLSDGAHSFAGVAVAASPAEVFYAFVDSSTKYLQLAHSDTYIGAIRQQRMTLTVDVGANFTQLDLDYGDDLFTLAFVDPSDVIHTARVVLGTNLYVRYEAEIGAGAQPVIANDGAGARIISYVASGKLQSQFLDAGSWTPRGRWIGIPGTRIGYMVSDADTGSRRTAGVAFTGGKWVLAAVDGGYLRVSSQTPAGLLLESDSRALSSLRGTDVATATAGEPTIAMGRASSTRTASYGCH